MRHNIRKLWDIVASVRFAIALLMALAIVSVFGMLIPQNLSSQAYTHSLGHRKAALVLSLGLDHIFSSACFYLLIGALCANILACSLRRGWKNLSPAARSCFLSHDAMAKMEHHQTMTVSEELDNSASKIFRHFRFRLFACSMQSEPSGFRIAAKTGMIRQMGSVVFHMGIVLLIAGGLAGTIKGYSYIESFGAGDVSAVPQESFRVQCDWFKIEESKGVIADYKTKLSILDSLGNVQAEKVIEVNAPLRFQGIRFYQSSYGIRSDRFDSCRLRIQGPGMTEFGMPVTAVLDSAIPLPGTDLKLAVTRFVPDFTIDLRTRQATTRSHFPHNPAIRVLLFRKTDTLTHSWVFQKHPHFHSASQRFRISFLDYEPSLYTGIQIVKSPGSWLIWTALISMTLAVFALFFGHRSTIWVHLKQTSPSDTMIYLAASYPLTKESSSAQFRNTCASIRNLFKAKGNS